VVDQPWFLVALIICVGSVLWLAACVVVASLLRYRRRRKLLTSNKYVNGTKPGKSRWQQVPSSRNSSSDMN